MKPANILFQGDTPRLADFGISRVLKSTSQSSNIMGTPSYMAPEAFDGKRNEQTDIWSVGVIFYQLLAGRLPFEEADITSLLGAIFSRNPDPLPVSVPKSLQNVIARALAKDVNVRYKSAAEMRSALRNPHETDPNFQPEKSILTVVSPSVNTSPPQSFHPPTEKKSNPPHFIYAIAGLLAVMIIVGGLIWVSNSKSIEISSNKSANSSSENKKSELEKPTSTAVTTPVVQRKLILECLSGNPGCKILWDHNQTIETSKSRVLVKFKDSGKTKTLTFGDFIKRDLSGFDPMELEFQTVEGKQPDTVKVFQVN